MPTQMTYWLLPKGSFEHHLQKLEKVLARLKEAGLKVDANKSFFAREGLEYLRYWMSRKGIQPLNAKVEAIQRDCTTKEQARISPVHRHG